MWKDSIRNIVVIFQPNILRIIGFYVRHSATVFAHFLMMEPTRLKMPFEITKPLRKFSKNCNTSLDSNSAAVISGLQPLLF